MKLASTLALGFAAALLWNCNDAATEPETTSVDPRIPNTINTVSEYAAITAGYRITSKAAALPDSNDGDFFSVEMFESFRDAGICENFVLLLEELMTNIHGGGQSADPFAASPRLRNVSQCLVDNSQAFTAAAPSESQVLSVIDECFCAGSGSLFGNFAISKYAPPKFTGYAPPAISSETYAPPAIPGYSAPAIPGDGYAPPKL